MLGIDFLVSQLEYVVELVLLVDEVELLLELLDLEFVFVLFLFVLEELYDYGQTPLVCKCAGCPPQ